MLRAQIAAGILLVLAAPVLADGHSPLRRDLLGKEPPELAAGMDDWLAGPPVSLQKLKGSVVWLQFNF
jgi:hypothetical protein